MEWTRGPRIGHGSSAAVSVAAFHKSCDILAVKSADLRRAEPLQHEQRILSSLDCPHIVTYKGYDITSESGKRVYNLFMEYLPRGTLTDEIRKRGGKLDEPRITRYSRQIARGIDYLHSRGLVHCDIKGRNILIGEDGAKIADFGCAKSADEVGSCCGTPAFMAPEVARGEEQGKPADIWAFGCTVIEMATGRSLWGGDGGDPLSVLYRIGFSDASAEIPGSLSEEAKDFLEKCLRRNPEDRWTTSQLLNHPFLVDPTTCSSPNRASDSSSSSPTSILDLGFWNSVETESEITKSSSQFTQSCEEEVSPSAANRIGQLAGPSGRWPGWAGNDVDWVTVRGNFGGGGDRDGGDNDEKHGNAGSVEVEEVGIGPVGSKEQEVR
ncbi:mitogen-activated protein kinase kinase kinase 18-like [Punica granatum]|uniref:Mitogen-activated protein kinase kinase kinase 18-like n=1 Tax=Punica granatum TaxID=22663 RepID=A0A218WT40_PUNGR|nr:mitogen-activated protein kinase kinase kinase 18-like [Punica granatum]OWM75381.1 hypothetical protein CDL15_Pgr021545 [Punica granatum]